MQSTAVYSIRIVPIDIVPVGYAAMSAICDRPQAYQATVSTGVHVRYVHRSIVIGKAVCNAEARLKGRFPFL